MQSSVCQPWKRFLGILTAVFILCSAFFAFGAPKTAQAARTFTVYLQAGHSPASMGSGAAYNGVKEAVINEQLTARTYWAIRSRGINVRLLNPISLDSSLPSLITAPPAEHAQYSFYSPEPAMLSAITYPEAFDPTVTEQGDLVVSIHHNAAPNPAVNGYEVYYSSSIGGEYGKDVTAMRRSKRAAELIASSLQRAPLGISPRAPVVRDANNNGITKNSPVASVVLEMGYMSNAHDFSVMRTSSYQEQAASRIADAVIAYRDECWNPNTSVTLNSFTANFVAEEPARFELNAAFTPDSDVASVRTAVWPVADGAEHAKWYPLTLNASGSYSANISVADFDYREELYAFHTYVTDTNGRKENMAQAYETVSLTTADLAPPTAASVTAVADASQPSSALLRAANVTDASGVASVRFAVRGPGEQSQLQWYDGILSGSDWIATTDTSHMQGEEGFYSVYAYGKDAPGNEGLLGATTVYLAAAARDVDPPTMNGDFSRALVGRHVLTLKASDIQDASGVESVDFAVWGAADQSDLAWYPGIRSGDDWEVALLLSAHSRSDSYTVHVYAADIVGNRGLIANAVVSTDVDAPQADSVTAAQIPSAVPLGFLAASNVRDPSGVSGVRFAVWSAKDGQDDLIWYDAGNMGADWTVNFTPAFHNNEMGLYHVHAYATDGAGNTGLIGAATLVFESPEAGQARGGSERIAPSADNPALRGLGSVEYAIPGNSD